MLILTPEGREIGRFGDFYPPQEFVEKFRECTAADDNLKEAEKLLSEDPKSVRGLYLKALGNLYKDGKQPEAFAGLKELARKEPAEDVKFYVRRALWILAKTAHLRTDKKSAVEERNKHLEKLLEIDPRNESGYLIEASYMLGVSAMARRDAGVMKKHFDRIRKLDPDDKSGYGDDLAFAEAMAPYYKKDFKAVADGLAEFVKKHAGSSLVPKAYVQMAVCLYRAKQKEKAIEVLEKLLKEYPQAKEVGAAEKWLKRLKKQ